MPQSTTHARHGVLRDVAARAHRTETNGHGPSSSPKSNNGVSGQIGGHNNQTGADGYIGTNGACLNGNSLP